MATRKKTTGNRATLVEGCGTILKNNRLKGGYKLVKRKKSVTTATAKDSATAPAKRRGRPAKAKVTTLTPVSVVAKRRGRKKSTATASIVKPSVKMVAKKSTRGRRKKTAKA